MVLNITRVSHDTVSMTVGGMEIIIWSDRHSGAPVVQIDTPELPENEDGPIMRLNLNDHTYLDNDGAQEIEDECKLCNAGLQEHDLVVHERSRYVNTPVSDLKPEDMVDMEFVFQYLFHLDIEPDHTDWDNSKYELWQMADPATEPGEEADMVIMHFENNNSYAVPADLMVPVLNQPNL